MAVATVLSRSQDLAAILLELGLVDEQVLAQARSLRNGDGEVLGKTLVDMGVLSEEQLFQAYSRLTGLPLWDGELW